DSCGHGRRRRRYGGGGPPPRACSDVGSGHRRRAARRRGLPGSDRRCEATRRRAAAVQTVRPIPRAPLVAAFAGIVSLAILDGWLPSPFDQPTPSSNPEEVRAAFSGAEADLAARARTFQSNPDVRRSIAGGGIAVNRIALFAAARQALEQAPPGTWLVL